MHVTKDQFSDKFNNGWKKRKMAAFVEIFRILRQKFDFVGAIKFFFMYLVQICYVCYQ